MSEIKTPFQENFETSYTYIEGFMRNVRRRGDSPALTVPATGEQMTYKELNREVNLFANALQSSGVHKGDVIMYMLRNSIEFVLCYLAPQKLGAINCPINYHQSAGEIALNIEDSKPKVFIYDIIYKQTVQEALALNAYQPDDVLFVCNCDEEELVEGHISLREFIKRGSIEEPVVTERISIYDECTRLYTSGTTSRPKGVPVYVINEVLSAHDVIMHFPLSARDKTLNMTPWFHRGGLHSGGPCPTLYVGGEMIIMSEFNAHNVLSYVEKYGISFLIGVPATLNMLYMSQLRRHADLSGLKGIVTMGSPLDRESCIRFQETLTPNIYNGYGTTETFWNTFLSPADLPEHAGSCGRACTDDDVRIVKIGGENHISNPDDLVAMDGKEVGEIILGTSAKSGMGYYDNEFLTNAKFHDGFFYTGDLGVWDEDGYVTVVSRKDDMIVCAGENIYPSQIESVLDSHPAVAESCVIGVHDTLREQVPAAYVVFKPGYTTTIRDLSKYVNSHPMLATYKRPKFYRICESLPRTATGKLQRFEVKKMVEDDYSNGLFKR